MGAILWLACVQFFVFEQVVRWRWTQPYSFSTNFISDLGAAHCSVQVCSPWHALMNGSFVLQGLLTAGGALLTWKRWDLPGRIGMGLLLICGVGVVMVGFVPEDANGVVHRVGAALHFLGGGLGILAVGLSLRQGFGWCAVAVGGTVLSATVAVGLGSSWNIGVGALERVAAYGIAGWMVAAGFWLYRQINVHGDPGRDS
jgi:hypothetical membrane protein